jgi:hypothetical protein
MLMTPGLYLPYEDFLCNKGQKCVSFEPLLWDYSGLYQVNKYFSRGM